MNTLMNGNTNGLMMLLPLAFNALQNKETPWWQTGLMLLSMFMPHVSSIFAWLVAWFPKVQTRRSVTLQGYRGQCVAAARVMVDHNFSLELTAMLHYITNHINHSVHSLRHELNVQTQTSMYLLDQQYPYLLNESLGIYATFESFKELKNTVAAGSPLSSEANNQTERFVMTIWSNTCSIEVLLKYIDDITVVYVQQEKKRRMNKLFVYDAQNFVSQNIGIYFVEMPFESGRSFSNVFFDEKEAFLQRVKFFMENKEWYYQHGVPYTLGIGLSGPPGTGKTSLIKALANYTSRHLVTVPLKSIKHKAELRNILLNETLGNGANSVQIRIKPEDRIIVFEDIDCSVPWVSRRKSVKQEEENDAGNEGNNTTKPNEDKDKFQSTITLDDFLNLLDGICEAPGRILVISSNHYDDLDPALTRPGRIDIHLNMSYASPRTILEMFAFYFPDYPFPKDKEACLASGVRITTAQVSNLCNTYVDRPDMCIQALFHLLESS